MILFKYFMTASLLIFSFQLRAQVNEQVETVPYVDLLKYQGTWFEIAAIPQSFQKKCIKNTSAYYELDPKTNYVKVLNSCTEADGKINKAEGRARVEDKATNSKLKVTFVKLLGWVFTFGGDYWILDIDQDYQWVVIGHPDRSYAWILSRNKFLSPEILRTTEQILLNNGYDTCELLTSIQDGGLEKRIPLCEINKIQINSSTEYF